MKINELYKELGRIIETTNQLKEIGELKEDTEILLDLRHFYIDDKHKPRFFDLELITTHKMIANGKEYNSLMTNSKEGLTRVLHLKPKLLESNPDSQGSIDTPSVTPDIDPKPERS